MRLRSPKLCFALIIVIFLLYVWLHNEETVDFEFSCDQPLLTVEWVMFTGMGNAMFQYASLLGITDQINRTAVFRRSNEKIYYRLFKLISKSVYHETAKPQTLSKWLNTTIPIVGCETRGWVKTDWNNWYDLKRYANLPSDKNYIATGFLESYKYFNHLKDRLRDKEFVFKAKITEAANAKLAEIRNAHCLDKNCQIVGVHVRRGMKLTKHSHCHFSSAGTVYLRNAMSYYEKKFAQSSNLTLVFAVVGDDYSWNVAHLPLLTKRPTVVLKSSTAAVDMRFLSLCDQLIINVGTYGWWAGYLGNGTVVYPDHFGQWRNSPDSNGQLTNDFYPPEWVMIPRSNSNQTKDCANSVEDAGGTSDFLDWLGRKILF